MIRFVRPTNLLLLTMILVLGCSEKKPPDKPGQVSATVIEATESDNNNVAKYSDGIYQQFFDVRLEITETPELAGKWINLRAETRIGSSGQIASEGTRLKFFIEPQIINREEACSLDDLIGWTYVKE